MKTYAFEVVSHTEPTPEDVLTGQGDIVADHSLGTASFTADATHNGRTVKQFRFGVMVLADAETAHHMELPEQSAVPIISGLLDRFKEVLTGIFGEEAFQLAVMHGVVLMLGVDEEEQPIEPDLFGDTLN